MNGNDRKIKTVAIVGPTASGKTALAIRLAGNFNGEIVSCDSMQVYRNMDIGTAKPSQSEMSMVPHHLINAVDCSENFSCADYKLLADRAIEEISSRGRLPVICGGTGLYLDTLLSAQRFSPDIPRGIREELDALSSEQLWEELVRVDPVSASSIHINNRKRVIRALEICRGTGKPKSYWDSVSRLEEPPYDALIIGLDFSDRSVLYDRINSRVDSMIMNGLADEVSSLAGVLSKTASQAIGYRELLLWKNGTLPLDSAVEMIKKDTRNYAKRQLTWFRRNGNVNWFYPDVMPAEEIYKKIVNIVANHLS